MGATAGNVLGGPHLQKRSPTGTGRRRLVAGKRVQGDTRPWDACITRAAFPLHPLDEGTFGLCMRKDPESRPSPYRGRPASLRPSRVPPPGGHPGAPMPLRSSPTDASATDGKRQRGGSSGIPRRTTASILAGDCGRRPDGRQVWRTAASILVGDCGRRLLGRQVSRVHTRAPEPGHHRQYGFAHRTARTRAGWAGFGGRCLQCVTST